MHLVVFERSTDSDKSAPCETSARLTARAFCLGGVVQMTELLESVDADTCKLSSPSRNRHVN